MVIRTQVGTPRPGFPGTAPGFPRTHVPGPEHLLAPIMLHPDEAEPHSSANAPSPKSASQHSCAHRRQPSAPASPPCSRRHEPRAAGAALRRAKFVTHRNPACSMQPSRRDRQLAGCSCGRLRSSSAVLGGLVLGGLGGGGLGGCGGGGSSRARVSRAAQQGGDEGGWSSGG
jgi:hypothetical protein